MQEPSFFLHDYIYNQGIGHYERAAYAFNATTTAVDATPMYLPSSKVAARIKLAYPDHAVRIGIDIVVDEGDTCPTGEVYHHTP